MLRRPDDHTLKGDVRRTPSRTPTPAECGPADHAPRSSPEEWGDDAAFERAASFFQAAADVARLKLLARLSGGEWCVTELAQAAGLSMSTISENLRRLWTVDMVKRRRAGKHVYYTLADDHIVRLIRSALEHAGEAPVPEDK
jgi:ArsR family transcriptional regulator, lead/cadmium/zinc/bismuth-responsive transcriptional repressor